MSDRAVKNRGKAKKSRATEKKGTASFEEKLKEFEAARDYRGSIDFYEQNLPDTEAKIYLMFFIDILTKVTAEGNDKIAHNNLLELLKKEEYKKLEPAVNTLRINTTGSNLVLLMKVLLKKSFSSLGPGITRATKPYYRDESYLDELDLPVFYKTEIRRYINESDLEQIIIELKSKLPPVQVVPPAPLPSPAQPAQISTIKDELKNAIHAYFKILGAYIEEYFEKRLLVQVNIKNRHSKVEAAAHYLRVGAEILRIIPQTKALGATLKAGATITTVIIKLMSEPPSTTVVEYSSEKRMTVEYLALREEAILNAILQLSPADMSHLRDFYKKLNEEPLFDRTGWKIFDWIIFFYHTSNKGVKRMTINIQINLPRDEGIKKVKTEVVLHESEESENFQIYWVGLLLKFYGDGTRSSVLEFWGNWPIWFNSVNGSQFLYDISISWPNGLYAKGNVSFSTTEPFHKFANRPTFTLGGDNKIFASIMWSHYGSINNGPESVKWSRYQDGDPLPGLPMDLFIDTNRIKFIIQSKDRKTIREM